MSCESMHIQQMDSSIRLEDSRLHVPQWAAATLSLTAVKLAVGFFSLKDYVYNILWNLNAIPIGIVRTGRRGGEGFLEGAASTET